MVRTSCRTTEDFRKDLRKLGNTMKMSKPHRMSAQPPAPSPQPPAPKPTLPRKTEMRPPPQRATQHQNQRQPQTPRKPPQPQATTTGPMKNNAKFPSPTTNQCNEPAPGNKATLHNFQT